MGFLKASNSFFMSRQVFLKSVRPRQFSEMTLKSGYSIIGPGLNSMPALIRRIARAIRTDSETRISLPLYSWIAFLLSVSPQQFWDFKYISGPGFSSIPAIIRRIASQLRNATLDNRKNMLEKCKEDSFFMDQRGLASLTGRRRKQ